MKSQPPKPIATGFVCFRVKINPLWSRCRPIRLATSNCVVRTAEMRAVITTDDINFDGFYWVRTDANARNGIVVVVRRVFETNNVLIGAKRIDAIPMRADI